MRKAVRSLIRIVVPTVLALGIAALVIPPATGDSYELPLLASATVAGLAIVVEVFRVSRCSGRLAWEKGPALWSKRRPLPPTASPDPLLEWEGLLASARKERGRGRQRFLRRVSALATPRTRPLVEAMASAETAELDRLVARFIEESRSV